MDGKSIYDVLFYLPSSQEPLNPLRDQSQVTIGVFVPDPDSNLYKSKDEPIQQIASSELANYRTLPGYKFVSGQPMKDNGYRFAFTSFSPSVLRVEALTKLSTGQLVIESYIAPSNTFQRYMPAFETISSSLKVLPISSSAPADQATSGQQYDINTGKGCNYLQLKQLMDAERAKQCITDEILSNIAPHSIKTYHPECHAWY